MILEDGENTKYIDDGQPRVFHTLTSRGTYGSSNNYHDVITIADAADKIRSVALFSMLDKNMIEVSVPGTAILAKKICCGDIINISFLNSGANVREEPYDLAKSGNYFVFDTRHMFKEGLHTVFARVTKLNRKTQQ
jgi:hypothetical protein